MKKLLSILLALTLVLGLLAGCASSADQGAEEATEEAAAETDGGEEAAADDAAGTVQVNKEDLKVALILPSNIDDQGWSTAAYLGLQAIEETYGCETHYSEFVGQSEMEERFRTYAESGYNVIFGHGSEFFDAAAAVAPDFPDVAFIITSTDQYQEPNVASVNTLPTEMGALAGAAMAYATKTKKVGVVGGMSLVSIVAACNAAIAAVHMIDPEIEVMANMTGSDDDQAKAKEVTQAMIDRGADVIFYDADAAGLGSLEACQENGVLAVPAVSLNETDVTLMAAGNEISLAMDVAVGYVVDGTFKAGYYPMGCAEGCVFYEPYEPVWNEALSEEGKAGVQELYEKFVNHELDAGQMIEEYVPADELLS